MRRVINIKDSDLRNIVSESIKKILKENYFGNDELGEIITIINQKLYHQEMVYKAFVRDVEEIKEELQNAIDTIKREVNEIGLGITGVIIEDNGEYSDEIVIKMGINWVIDVEDIYDSPKDYKIYKYLQRIERRKYSHIKIELDAESRDENPFFTIKCNIPAI